jgi:hypothetical protein
MPSPHSPARPAVVRAGRSPRARLVVKIAILWTIGIIVLVIGLILAVLGMVGHGLRGRRHYF